MIFRDDDSNGNYNRSYDIKPQNIFYKKDKNGKINFVIADFYGERKKADKTFICTVPTTANYAVYLSSYVDDFYSFTISCMQSILIKIKYGEVWRKEAKHTIDLFNLVFDEEIKEKVKISPEWKEIFNGILELRKKIVLEKDEMPSEEDLKKEKEFFDKAIKIGKIESLEEDLEKIKGEEIQKSFQDQLKKQKEKIKIEEKEAKEREDEQKRLKEQKKFMEIKNKPEVIIEKNLIQQPQSTTQNPTTPTTYLSYQPQQNSYHQLQNSIKPTTYREQEVHMKMGNMPEVIIEKNLIQQPKSTTQNSTTYVERVLKKDTEVEKYLYE